MKINEDIKVVFLILPIISYKTMKFQDKRTRKQTENEIVNTVIVYLEEKFGGVGTPSNFILPFIITTIVIYISFGIIFKEVMKLLSLSPKIFNL